MDSSAAAKDAGLILSDRTVKGITRKKVEVKAKGKDEKDIFYQRDSGRYQKGDRKIQKQVEDLMPIFRGLNKSGSPEEAAKYFLSGTYK